jgi:hypothetical protein
LGVPQVGVYVGVEYAVGDGFFVVGAGDDVLAFFAFDDGGSGVLASWEDSAGGNGRVLEKVKSYEPVIGAGFGVVEDVAELLKMPGTKQMRNVVHGFRGEFANGFGIYLEERFAVGFKC